VGDGVAELSGAGVGAVEAGSSCGVGTVVLVLFDGEDGDGAACCCEFGIVILILGAGLA
jgi:hypothetical protein